MDLSPGLQGLDSYTQWVAQAWMGSPGGLDERDFTVMSLGLGGEMGEVMAVVEATMEGQPLDLANATKEMGDVFYYWCRLIHAFDLSASQLLTGPDSSVGADCQDLDALALALPASLSVSLLPSVVSLSARIGVVQELMKKRVRDGAFDPAAFSLAMGEVGVAWVRAAHAMGLRPTSIVRANVEKLTSRHERGVMGGNGDNRYRTLFPWVLLSSSPVWKSPTSLFSFR